MDDLEARRQRKTHRFGLRLAFDRDSQDFCDGFECGRLDSRLAAKPERWEGTYQATNAEMLRRIAAANHYEVEIEDSGTPGWVFATFFPCGGEPGGGTT